MCTASSGTVVVITAATIYTFIAVRLLFFEYSIRREAEHGYDTAAVFCDVFPKICGDVL